MMRSPLEREDLAFVAEAPYRWEAFAGKRVLVSGGTGFLGSFLLNIFRYRNEKYGNQIKAVCLTRHARESDGTVEYFEQDVTAPLRYTGGADYIVHLASNTHPAQYAAMPVETITANVFGCYNLLEYARKCGAQRFLLASSVEIYGNGNGTPMDETFAGAIDCNSARAGYNEAKRVSEALCQSFRAQYGMDSVIARLARCFGADQKKDSKALAQFFERAVSGEDIVLKSAGRQRFSYCYVADAVSGLIKILLDGENGEAYNISEDDEGKSLGDYAGEIAALAGQKVIMEAQEVKGASKADYAVLDCAKLKSLGWQPLFTVAEGLKRTYRIYKGE